MFALGIEQSHTTSKRSPAVISIQTPARMHGLSASVEAAPAGGGLTAGAAEVCAKSGAALMPKKKAKLATSVLRKDRHEIWFIKTS